MTKRSTTQLLTLEEAEKLTRRKKSTWRRDILERKIPYVKIGRSVRIPVEVVNELIERGWREPVTVGEIR